MFALRPCKVHVFVTNFIIVRLYIHVPHVFASELYSYIGQSFHGLVLVFIVMIISHIWVNIVLILLKDIDLNSKCFN